MKLYRILILWLFLTLPLIHGRIFPTLWIPFFLDIDWNFEFTKSIFFNIFSAIIFLSYIGQRVRSHKLTVWYIEIALSLLLVISTVFSLSPLTSLIWDVEKWHTTLLFFNLLWIFIILKNEQRAFLKKCIYVYIVTCVFVALLSIKELFFPSYNYWALDSRALGSFWHPNYLAGYLLWVLPFLSQVKNLAWKYVLYILIPIAIIFSQSFVAIWILFVFFSYQWARICKIPRKIFSVIVVLMLFIACMSLVAYFPEKLHSFLSRFYLWETTLKIIVSDIKIFIFWAGLETLPYVFESFKSPELYIYENYGYTADRPHNIVLNVLYHFWILWVSLLSYLIYIFIRRFKYTPEYISLLMLLIFWIFHYFSIASYLVIILLVSLSYKAHLKIHTTQHYNIKALCVYVYICLSIMWAFYSTKLYAAEIVKNKWDYSAASKIFPLPEYFREIWDYENAIKYEWIISYNTVREQIITNKNKTSLCEILVEDFPSAENYFYCGKIFESLGEDMLMRQYYTKGLSYLPNLWAENSPYWNNYFIKNTITGNRFFSPKFWNILEILEKTK